MTGTSPLVHRFSLLYPLFVRGFPITSVSVLSGQSSLPSELNLYFVYMGPSRLRLPSTLVCTATNDSNLDYRCPPNHAYATKMAHSDAAYHHLLHTSTLTVFINAFSEQDARLWSLLRAQLMSPALPRHRPGSVIPRYNRHSCVEWAHTRVCPRWIPLSVSARDRILFFPAQLEPVSRVARLARAGVCRVCAHFFPCSRGMRAYAFVCDVPCGQERSRLRMRPARSRGNRPSLSALPCRQRFRASLHAFFMPGCSLLYCSLAYAAENHNREQ